MQPEATLRVVRVEVEDRADLAQAIGQGVAMDAELFGGRALRATVLEVDPERLPEEAAAILAQQLANQAVDIAMELGRSPAIVDKAKCPQVDVVVEMNLRPGEESPLL